MNFKSKIKLCPKCNKPLIVRGLADSDERIYDTWFECTEHGKFNNNLENRK